MTGNPSIDLSMTSHSVCLEALKNITPVVFILWKFRLCIQKISCLRKFQFNSDAVQICPIIYTKAVFDLPCGLFVDVLQNLQGRKANK